MGMLMGEPVVVSVLNPASLILRPVAPADNAQLETLVHAVLTEFGCIGPGYASSDPELKDLHATYQPVDPQALDRAYWVIENPQTGILYGGGGFSRLKGTTGEAAICELQKLYFDPAVRGLGLGRRLLTRCLKEAGTMGYKTMYLETVSQMASAVTLYQKLGFALLPQPMGNTGHTSCTVFMSCPLVPPL